MASRVADAATTELETLIAELRQRHVSDPGMASALALQDGPALLIDLGPSERAVMLDELQKAAPSLPVDDLIDSVEGLKRRKGKHSGGGGNGADGSVVEDAPGGGGGVRFRRRLLGNRFRPGSFRQSSEGTSAN